MYWLAYSASHKPVDETEGYWEATVVRSREKGGGKEMYKGGREKLAYNLDSHDPPCRRKAATV
jgi:hypothetical protein